MRVLIQFQNKPLLFRNPKGIISCSNPRSFSAAFENIERALSAGYYVAGFLSYEAGYCFEERLRQEKTYDFPLIHFGVYDPPLLVRLNTKKAAVHKLRNLSLNIAKGNYSRNINIIREYIRRGDVYQITYCIKLLFDFQGDPFGLYKALLRQQPVPYPAYIETDQLNILSLSPEMFIRKHGEHVVTKPMKGTWMRGRNSVSDLFAGFRLHFDEKNRAENLMIADLLRNDLGRIGLGIKAPKLFEVAKYRTLYQMTSTVTGRIDKNIPVYDLFAALFPSGSVTGAPKIRAMEIIKSLEGEERNIYTGAIGYISPDKDMFFNIPIRTLLVRGGKGEMGIGGGIVWDSTPEGEWTEGMLKAKFVIESLLT